MGDIGRFIHFLVSRFIICRNRIVIGNLSFTNFDVKNFLCRAPFSNPQFTEQEGRKIHRAIPTLKDEEKDDAKEEYNTMFKALVQVTKKEEKVKEEKAKAKAKKSKGTVMDDASAPNKGNQNDAPEIQETQNAATPGNNFV
jgi:hypothetical protein